MMITQCSFFDVYFLGRNAVVVGAKVRKPNDYVEQNV